MNISRIVYEDDARWDGSGPHESTRVVYQVSGAESISDAAELVRTTAWEEASDGLAVESVELSKTVVPGVYNFSVSLVNDETHSAPLSGKTDENTWSFSASPHMERIYRPIAWKFRSANAPSDIQGINFDGERYNGVDVPSPVLTKTFSRKYAAREWDNSFEQTIASLLGKINAGAWKGYPAGSLRLMECNASSTGIRKKRIVNATFKFDLGQAAGDFDFHGIRIPHKDPWDYAFPYYDPEVLRIDGEKRIVPSAKAVFVVQVHRSGNFDLLKL